MESERMNLLGGQKMTENVKEVQKPVMAKRGVLITLLAIAVAVTVSALAVSTTQSLRGSVKATVPVMNLKADTLPVTSSKAEKNEIIAKMMTTSTSSRDDNKLVKKEAAETSTNAKLAKVQSAVQKTQAEVKKMSKMLPVETKEEKKDVKKEIKNVKADIKSEKKMTTKVRDCVSIDVTIPLQSHCNNRTPVRSQQ